MALLKQIETPHGATVEYWRVGWVYPSVLNESARIHLVGYVNEVARLDNRPHLEERTFEFRGAHFFTLVMSPIPEGAQNVFEVVATACYNAIKQTPEFADAEDV